MQAHTGLCAYLEVALQLLANEFVVKDASSNRQTGPLGLLHHTLQINNISMSEQNIVNNSLSSVAPFIKLVQDFAELLHLKKKKKKKGTAQTEWMGQTVTPSSDSLKS